MITLKTLPQATAQEVFDQITQHLLKQGKAAKSVPGACHYRVEKEGEVLKCAAGCLIADDEYSVKLEGTDWIQLAADGIVPNNHEKLIYRLQSVHDCRDTVNWPKSFKEVANYFGLVYEYP